LSCIDQQPGGSRLKINQVGETKLFGQADAMLPGFSESSENYISQWPVFDDLITEVLAINQASFKNNSTTQQPTCFKDGLLNKKYSRHFIYPAHLR
jgi:hypothetical protein